MWSLADPSYKPASEREVVVKEREPREPKEKEAKVKSEPKAEAKAKVSQAERQAQWFKKEYTSFYKTVTSFGLALKQGAGGLAYDWDWIKANARLTHKTVALVKTKYEFYLHISSQI